MTQQGFNLKSSNGRTLPSPATRSSSSSSYGPAEGQVNTSWNLQQQQQHRDALTSMAHSQSVLPADPVAAAHRDMTLHIKQDVLGSIARSQWSSDYPRLMSCTCCWLTGIKALSTYGCILGLMYAVGY